MANETGTFRPASRHAAACTRSGSCQAARRQCEAQPSMGGAGWRSPPPGAAGGCAGNPNRNGERPLREQRAFTGSVEVPGIEPGSFVALLGLLRAQLTVPLLGPTDHASESV